MAKNNFDSRENDEIRDASFGADAVKGMVLDFLADHADEYAGDPLVMDGEIVYDDEYSEYVQFCHDSDTDYALVPYANGEVRLWYIGSR